MHDRLRGTAVIIITAVLSLVGLAAAPALGAEHVDTNTAERNKIRWGCAFWSGVQLGSWESDTPGPGHDVPVSLIAYLRIKNPGSHDRDREYFAKHPTESCVPVLTEPFWPGWLGKIRVALFKVVPSGPDQRLRTFRSDPFRWRDSEHGLGGRVFSTAAYCGEGIDGVGTRYHARVGVKRKSDPVPLVLRSPNLKAEKAWDCPPFGFEST